MTRLVFGRLGKPRPQVPSLPTPARTTIRVGIFCPSRAGPHAYANINLEGLRRIVVLEPGRCLQVADGGCAVPAFFVGGGGVGKVCDPIVRSYIPPLIVFGSAFQTFKLKKGEM